MFVRRLPCLEDTFFKKVFHEMFTNHNESLSTHYSCFARVSSFHQFLSLITNKVLQTKGVMKHSNKNISSYLQVKLTLGCHKKCSSVNTTFFKNVACQKNIKLIVFYEKYCPHLCCETPSFPKKWLRLSKTVSYLLFRKDCFSRKNRLTKKYSASHLK